MKMTRFTLVLGILLSFTIIATSCGGSRKTVKNDSDNASLGQMNSNRMPDISGRWVLQSLNGQKVEDVFKGKTPSMTVDFDTKRISGNGGCNRFNGSFTLESGMFSAPNLASTMMMCPFENRESEFHAALAKSSKVTILNSNKLTLENEGKVIAEFVKGIDSDMLTGTWQLVSIEGEDMKTLFPMSERQATLEFNVMEHRIGGNAGCNGYGASYTMEGNKINVGPIMATKMACGNLSGENKFTQLLSGTSEISVSQEELSVSKDGKVVLKLIKKK